MKTQQKQTENIANENNETENENFLNIPKDVDRENSKLDARQQALKAIEFSAIPRVMPKENLGRTFDIVDAVGATINGDSAVNFVIEFHDKRGEQFVANKSLNAFTKPYLDYFKSFDNGDDVIPMRGYCFTERTDLPKKNGNHPITLERVKAQA